jgi:hypothetical protein
MNELRVDFFNSLSNINQRTMRMEHLLTNLSNHVAFNASNLAPSAPSLQATEDDKREEQCFQEMKMLESVNVQQMLHNQEPKIFHPSEALLMKYKVPPFSPLND